MPSRNGAPPQGRNERRSPTPLLTSAPIPPNLPPPPPTYHHYQPHPISPSPPYPSYYPPSSVNAQASSSTFRPPVPPFPDIDRRPITAPAAVPPPSYRGAPRSGGRRGRGRAYTSTAAHALPPPVYWQNDPYGGLGGTGGETQTDGQVYTSSRLDYTAGSSVHAYPSSPSTPLTPSYDLPMYAPAPPSGPSARRHSFPRHLHHPPLPSLLAQHPSTLGTGVATPPLPRGVPPLPADHSTAGVPGYQPDYVRATDQTMERPVLSLRPSTPGQRRVLPPPVEAFLTLRLRRAPRGGWPPVQREEGADWTTRLDVIQEPQMGLGMGAAGIATESPFLDPPLVIRIQFLLNGQPVSDHHPLVEKRLAYMTLHLSLFSADTDERVERVRFLSDYDTSSGTSSGGSTRSSDADSTPSQGALLALVGSTFGIAKAATLGPGQGSGSGQGWYFIFNDLRVRPTGLFRLSAKLIDILGPGPSGTSTGITPISSMVMTKPFTVFSEDTYPGAEPPTDLTRTLDEQGLMGRRRGSGEGSSSEGSD